MNKSAIRNFAIWARNKLKADVTYAMGMVGVTAKAIAEPLPQSTADVQFFDIGTKDYAQLNLKQIKQRQALVTALRVKQHGTKPEVAFDTLVEEVAYTWFNRLVAIRFMEVNDYLPGRVRVLSSENPAKLEPDLVTTPFDGGLDFTLEEEDDIRVMQDKQTLDALFRLLFIKECESLTAVLPVLFGAMDEWMELLLNISFTDKDGVVYHLVHDIAESDFNVEQEGQVEIVGWLYQYYNTELKDETFALLKKNVKITKERIPSATQLFTPDWIVRYMVENSLGRLWVEGHPNDNLKSNWKYYLEEAEQEPQVAAQLAEIRKDYAKLTPEDIKVIDPCMGSGHILVYAFDVLMQIYLANGYTERDAAQSILRNNLYGLDIDRRAAQLAYFAVMMKARQYDRRILTRGILPHVVEIVESRSNVGNEVFKQFEGCREIAYRLYETFKDAKEYGSILSIDLTEHDLQLLKSQLQKMSERQFVSFMDELETKEAMDVLAPLMEQADIMVLKYDAVVTNPPYMGASGMSTRLSDYVKANYPDTKSDMSTVCMEKTLSMCKPNGYMTMINIPVWMFLSSYEKMRSTLNRCYTYINMIHPGRGIFGSDFGAVTFVIHKRYVAKYKGTFFRLFDEQVEVKTPEVREQQFLSGKGKHISQQEDFARIPGMPVAYWVSDHFLSMFTSQKIGDIAKPRQGLATGENNRFLRMWHECSRNNIDFNCHSINESKESGVRWFPYNKGGDYRKWYGNNDFVVNWENDGYEIRHFVDEKGKLRSRPQNTDAFFRECITWSKISSGSIAFRYKPYGHIFDVAGTSVFADHQLIDYLQGLCNSVVALSVFNAISPTLNYEVGHIASVPVIFSEERRPLVERIVQTNIEMSKADWDSFETSWDFQCHPLISVLNTPDATSLGAALQYFYGAHPPKPSCPIELAFLIWQGECNKRFEQLKSNEEELNHIFIDIYGLQDELTPEVADKDVTVRKADLQRDIKSLVSYAVGCMFGRYSLDVPGLAYAGGEWDANKYRTYQPDNDNCLPITDEDYGIKDDIVSRFVDFIRIVYGEEELEKNLQYIADALENKGATAREVIRNYFLNDFFKDHCGTYSVTGSGKRPIYWLFDSGKQNGFKALVYMHRWNADTAGNVRVEYLHRMQHVYESEIQRMQETIDQSHDSKEIGRAEKRLVKLRKQLKETQDYDARLGHIALSRIDIDLDDGVKVNYEKVQTGKDGKKLEVLAKI